MLLGSDQARRTWIGKSNNEWDGLLALEIMSTGPLEDIQKINNRYLKTWCELIDIRCQIYCLKGIHTKNV